VVRILEDAQLSEQLDAARAVAWVREAVVAAHDGRLVAPPRVDATLGGGVLRYTAGELVGEWFGYRSYDTIVGGEQVVVVHRADDGRVAGIAVGSELGPRRTGAIGAVAVDALAPAAAATLGLVGTGRQAWTQAWAIASVRELAQVRVHGRDTVRRAAFVARLRSELGVAAVAAESVRAAVDGTDLVVLATASPTPVLEPGWVAPGAFVSTLGPKQVGRHEFGLDLVDAAALVVSDSPAQLRAYDPPGILAGTPHLDRVVHLGSVLGQRPAASDGITVFLSVGLAGTEAYLLARLLGVGGPDRRISHSQAT